MSDEDYDGRIPENLLESLKAYRDTGRPTGGFLRACLCNDLMEASSRADRDNQCILKDITLFIFNEMPSTCWGSPEKVDAWIKKFADERSAK